MLKIARRLAICAFALFSMNAMAQDNTDIAEPEERTADDVAAQENDADTAAQDASKTDENSADSTAQESPEEKNASEAGAPLILTDALLDKQLREVSTNLDTLKEDTFTTKSRLLLLREEVLQRSVSGSRLQIRHKNDMGGQYELTQIYYAIDRNPVFSKQDSSGELNSLDDEILYDHLVSPGAHQLNVLYVYKGKKWGVFRYMSEYTFRVESGYDFIVEEGRAAEIVVTAAEHGGAFTPYEERPSVTYDFKYYDMIANSADTAGNADGNSGE